MDMNIDDLLDIMDELIDKAWKVPLSSKSMVDVEQIKDVVQDIRLNMPAEIRQAKTIVADRNKIIADARREADTVIRVAEEKAAFMVTQEEIYKAAQQKANETVAQANKMSADLKRSTNEYIENMLKHTDEVLTQELTEIRKARQNMKNAGRGGDTVEAE